MADAVSEEQGEGTVVLLAAAPAGRGRLVDATAVLQAFAAVPRAALADTRVATVVELADPVDPQAVLTRLRAAADGAGRLAVYLAGQLHLDQRQNLPHLALARTTLSTLRYTALPWHWLSDTLHERRPGTTTVVADLVADAGTWRALEEHPDLLDLPEGTTLYGRVVPPPGRRAGRVVPEYLRACTTIWRTGARPPFASLHAQASARAAADPVLWLARQADLPVPEHQPFARPAGGASWQRPETAAEEPRGTTAPVDLPLPRALAEGGGPDAAAEPPTPAPAPPPTPRQEPAPVPTPPPAAVVPEPPAATPEVRSEPPAPVETVIAPEPPAVAPVTVLPEAPAEVAEGPARPVVTSVEPAAPDPWPEPPAVAPVTVLPQAVAAELPEKPEAPRAAAPVPEAPPRSAAPPAPPVADVPDARRSEEAAVGARRGAWGKVRAAARAWREGREDEPVAAPARPVLTAPGQGDPHPGILAAAQAGRHSEAAAAAAAWELDALRRHGPGSGEAIHWLEVRADLARLADEPGRSCELWIAAARARIGQWQDLSHPDVEGAVDRAHHQWEQILDEAKARALAPELLELRRQVPGRRAGALQAIGRKLERFPRGDSA